LIQEHKKIVLWGALLVWFAAAAAGALSYRRTISVAEERLAEHLRADIQNPSEGPYRKILEWMRNFSAAQGGHVALGEAGPVQVYVRTFLQDLPALVYADVVTTDGRVLVQAGEDPPPVKRRISVHPGDAEQPSAAVEFSPSGRAIERFAADVVFFEQPVGRIQVARTLAWKDPRGHYRTLLLAWIAGVPLLLAGIILALEYGERAYRRWSARRMVVALMALDLFWRERKARRRLHRAAVIHHIWTQEKARSRRERLGTEERVGPYVLKQRLARGGMAELFIAEKTRESNFRKIIALKRILPHLSSNPEFTERFIREARIAALLQHSNIVATNDFGRYGDSYIIAMEYVRGLNLAEIQAQLKQPLNIEPVVYIISQICRGLHYSHTKTDDITGEPLNIVHRDISPQNIMISYEGEVKISDFGIAKAASYSGFTQAGSILGKLSYMSPEQVTAGESVDARADIYALGIVFYELLSGASLFRYGSVAQALAEIPRSRVRPIDTLVPGIPEALARIVMKALEKERDRRYPTAQALLEELEALCRQLSITYSMTDLSNFMKRRFRELRPPEEGIPTSILFEALRDVLME